MTSKALFTHSVAKMSAFLLRQWATGVNPKLNSLSQSPFYLLFAQKDLKNRHIQIGLSNADQLSKCGFFSQSFAHKITVKS